MIRNCFEVQRASKAVREERKLPLRTIASETGLTKNALSSLSSGATKGITFETLDALCKYFGCGVGDLLEYIPDSGAQHE